MDMASDAAPLSFDAASTALVVVDLQNFTVGMPTVPFTGKEVLANAVRLADACRKAAIPVVLVRVGYGGFGAAPTLNLPADEPFSGFELPEGATEIAAELGPKPGDIIVDKYNWGAFYATNLDIQLRRRNIKTLIVGGLVTHIGVDTTMRQAQERGYAQVLASDAASSFARDEHDMVIQKIAPRMARVRKTDEILAALG